LSCVLTPHVLETADFVFEFGITTDHADHTEKDEAKVKIGLVKSKNHKDRSYMSQCCPCP
jgi:hypothetical protein